MARRKGLITQMIDAHKRAKKLEAQAEARGHLALIAEQKRQEADVRRKAKQDGQTSARGKGRAGLSEVRQRHPPGLIPSAGPLSLIAQITRAVV